MDLLYKIFGMGKDLNAFQMCSRSIIIFIVCLVFIRISGRRSFGVRTPFDNIIVIILGALLSRAVVGASPFLPIVLSSFIFVIFHRILGWIIVRHKKICRLVEGEKILLFENGSFIQHNLKRGLVSEEDVMQGVRKSALTDDMNKIKAVFIERNGDISPVRKD